MSDHRARAEKCRQTYGWPWCEECGFSDCEKCDLLIDLLAAAFAEVEDEALERAAAIVGMWKMPVIAAEIRALKEKP